MAEINKVNLEFEASVAGGIPILRTIKESLATNKIKKVYGILNGTCNYILSEMESSKDSFKNVLSRAQKLGYAEPGNPKLDLNGYDAFAKIRILSSLSFNKNISLRDQILFIILSYIMISLLISIPYFLSIYNFSFVHFFINFLCKKK